MSTRRQLLAALAAAPAASAPRPNFVFLLTDDHRWDMMGCAGHPFLRTPNLDRLAKEGARFSNAFVTTSLCSPARAGFLTGRYAHAHGVMGNWQDIAGSEVRRSFPALLQEAGYETAYVGKFHMGASAAPRRGFDHWAVLPGQGRYHDPVLNINGAMKTLPGHSAKVVTDVAVEWLRRPRKKPFCLIVGYKEAHGPHTPPPHLSSLYQDREVRIPEVRPEHLRGKPEEVARIQIAARHPKDHNIPGLPDDYRRAWKDYWRCITAADEQIGRVLAALDETGAAADTMTVFAGDNGFFLGELGLFDKRFAYEPSIRIPLLVRYPRAVQAGALVDRMALNIDLCPTVLDYAGVKPPGGIHGSSWRALFENRASHWRRWFLYEYFREPGYVYWPSIQALRTEQWKYIRYPEGAHADELYNIAGDPGELENLAGGAGHRGAAEAAALMKRLGWEIDRLAATTGGN